MIRSLFKRSATLLTTVLCCFTLSAQIELVEDLTPEQLIAQYLLGSGVTVSNITFNGQPGNIANEQIGAFYGSNSVLGLDSGIVLATGPISLVEGPNNAGGHTVPVSGTSMMDEDLAMIANQSTFDAAVLEFDFVPQADTLTFSFVFGSEEYIEFVNSINDVFGFFVSGPGLSGPFSNNAVNVALIPGTSDPVAINTVNPGMNADFYVDNGDGFSAPFNNDPFYLQLDGLTVEIVARIAVICGETYHMKMAISDASDNILDSGVFIGGGTFASPSSLNMALATTIGDGDLLEDCGTATLTITRSDVSEEIVLPLVLLGDATAEDIDGLPAEVVMQVGVGQVQIEFTAINDLLVEGSELLEISTSFEGGCSGGAASTTLYIHDVAPLEVMAEGSILDCAGTPVDLVAVAEGGYGDLEYVWSEGSPGPVLTVPGIPSTYTVTVTDECGNQAGAVVDLFTPCGIDIPNVFTPDNSGQNDLFVIENIEYTRNVLRIYNRWGQLVHEANNYQNNWNGGGLSDGTYFYEVIVEGDEQPYVGHVTILHNN